MSGIFRLYGVSYGVSRCLSFNFLREETRTLSVCASSRLYLLSYTCMHLVNTCCVVYFSVYVFYEIKKSRKAYKQVYVLQFIVFFIHSCRNSRYCRYRPPLEVGWTFQELPEEEESVLLRLKWSRAGVLIKHKLSNAADIPLVNRIKHTSAAVRAIGESGSVWRVAGVTPMLFKSHNVRLNPTEKRVLQMILHK